MDIVTSINEKFQSGAYKAYDSILLLDAEKSEVDFQLVNLLSKRFQLDRAIADEKKKRGISEDAKGTRLLLRKAKELSSQLDLDNSVVADFLSYVSRLGNVKPQPQAATTP